VKPLDERNARVIESAAMSQAGPHALAVPELFRDALLESHGEMAREWLNRLPGIVAELLERWSSEIAGPTMSGWAGVVVAVRRLDGTVPW
jgi:hypothetical protein